MRANCELVVRNWKTGKWHLPKDEDVQREWEFRQERRKAIEANRRRER